MKKRLLPVAFISAILSLWCSGCLLSPKSTTEKLSDGTAGDLCMEFAQMSSESSAGLAKTTATEAETIDTIPYSGQIVLQKWTYDPDSKWWFRSFEDSLSDGRAYTRTDSLQFTDSASQSKSSMPAWVTSSGWTHIRHVTRHGLVNTFNARFAMNVVVAKSSDTEATWNGTITGTWNGETLSNTTVTNVVRLFARAGAIHWWRFPTSGTIYIDNPLRTWNITFTGNGGATAVVTRKSDNKQKTFTITIISGKENE